MLEEGHRHCEKTELVMAPPFGFSDLWRQNTIKSIIPSRSIHLILQKKPIFIYRLQRYKTKPGVTFRTHARTMNKK